MRSRLNSDNAENAHSRWYVLIGGGRLDLCDIPLLTICKLHKHVICEITIEINEWAWLKVLRIRPMALVLNTGPLKVSEHGMLIFSVRKEIIQNDNSLVVILLSKVVENEFLQTL